MRSAASQESVVGEQAGRRQGARRRALAGPVAALLVVAFFFRASQNMAQTTLGLLGHDVLRLSPGIIGAEAALSSAAGMAGIGIAYRLPTRDALGGVVAGIALMSTSLALFAWAPGLAAFSGAAALLGLGGGLAFPSLATALGASSGGRADRVLAAYALALSSSLAVGTVAESSVIAITQGSVRAAFAAFAGSSCVALVVALGVAWASPSTFISRITRTGRADRSERRDLRRGGPPGGLWANPAWRLATVAQILYQVPFAALVVFGALYAKEAFGFGTAGAELSFAGFFGVSFVVRALVVARSPIRHKRKAFLVSGILTLGGVALLAVAPGGAVFLVAMAILGVPHGLMFPISLALVAEGVPRHRLSSANAALAAIITLVTVLTPAALGPVVGMAGPRTMFAIVLAPVALLLGWLALQSPASRGGEGAESVPGALG